MTVFENAKRILLEDVVDLVGPLDDDALEGVLHFQSTAVEVTSIKIRNQY